MVWFRIDDSFWSHPKVLGLSTDASTESVLDAPRRLIAKVHPDAGGSAELAARINEARDTLLKP